MKICFAFALSSLAAVALVGCASHLSGNRATAKLEPTRGNTANGTDVTIVAQADVSGGVRGIFVDNQSATGKTTINSKGTDSSGSSEGIFVAHAGAGAVAGGAGGLPPVGIWFTNASRRLRSSSTGEPPWFRNRRDSSRCGAWPGLNPRATGVWVASLIWFRVSTPTA